MKTGVLKYWVKFNGELIKAILLTVFEESDRGMAGTAELRRIRIERVLEEAQRQGARLGYADLELIFLVSRATIKRDIAWLRRRGRGNALSRHRAAGVEARP
jgi:hypothetical protein